jgi:acetylornithine/succinyldiaminopimelate/putrescine aminotransferase
MTMDLDKELEGMSPRKQEALRLAHAYSMPNRVETWLMAGVPLVIGRREGYRIWDVDGHELQDFHLNGGVFNLGHRNPELVATLRDALDTLDVGNHHFPSEERGLLAQKLAACTPEPLRYTVFTPSGSEANDTAIKTARQATGRRKVAAFANAYHGASGLSGAAGEDANARYFGSAFGDDFRRVRFNDLDALEAALRSDDVALFMAETLPATDGFELPDDNYYREARALCDRYGTLLMVDEVQTGLGRSGKLWAIEHYGIAPDMLVTGKGLGGGLYPIGALVVSEEVGGWLKEKGWGYVSTFGGSELGCRVASKALDLSSANSTRENVAANAVYMRAGLDGLRDRYPYMNDIRQLGVIFGLGFDEEHGAIRMAQELYKAGLWAMFAGFNTRYLQFKLGLLAGRAYCDEALGKLETALKTVARR